MRARVKVQVRAISTYSFNIFCFCLISEGSNTMSVAKQLSRREGEYSGSKCRGYIYQRSKCHGFVTSIIDTTRKIQ
jgi:hypothetical protein